MFKRGLISPKNSHALLPLKQHLQTALSAHSAAAPFNGTASSRRTDGGGRVFCSANKTIQACLAVTPKWTGAIRSIWTPSLGTNQADAVRDGSRPAVFVVSPPQRRPGWSPGLFVSPQLEPHVVRIGSARVHVTSVAR